MATCTSDAAEFICITEENGRRKMLNHMLSFNKFVFFELTVSDKLVHIYICKATAYT